MSTGRYGFVLDVENLRLHYAQTLTNYKISTSMRTIATARQR